MSNLHPDTQSVVSTLEPMGIHVPGTAPQDISVPSDISSIGDIGPGNIGELMGHIASYIAFLEYQVGLMEVDYENWNRAYEFRKSQVLLTLPNERRDIMEAKAEQQVQDVRGVAEQKRAALRLTKSILEGQKRMSDALSRELSRRGMQQSQRLRGLT